MSRIVHWVFGPLRQQPEPEHWADSDELHRAIHAFDGAFQGILLELLRGPMSRAAMRDFLRHPSLTNHAGGARGGQGSLVGNIEKGLQLGVVSEADGVYELTPRGRELAEHMARVIPLVIAWVLSPAVASTVAFVLHVVLSAIKVGLGIFAQSASLLADGVDNAVDALSAALVWVGVRYERVRLISGFLLVMMVISAGSIALVGVHKLLQPQPIREGPLALGVSLVAGVLMLGLSAYQYVVGRRRGNLAVLCQSVDSRNHFWTSLLVSLGVLLSYFTDSFGVPWLYYADPIAGFVIGVLVIRGAWEVGREVFRPSDGGEPDISHFVRSMQERHRRDQILRWVREQIRTEARSREELRARFSAEFCDGMPQIFRLTGLGLLPDDPEELNAYLKRFVEEGRLTEDEGRFWPGDVR